PLSGRQLSRAQRSLDTAFGSGRMGCSASRNRGGMGRKRELSQAPGSRGVVPGAGALGSARRRRGDDVYARRPEPRDVDELYRARPGDQRLRISGAVDRGLLHSTIGAHLDRSPRPLVLTLEEVSLMNRIVRVALTLIVGTTLAHPTPVRAQETASDTLLTVDHYLDWEQVGDPQLSPDGGQVIYTRRWVNKIDDKWESALWIMNADGTHNRFLVKGSDARWSPDGKRILYLADGDPKGSQVFVRWMDAEGPSSQVTRVTEMPTDPRWAPGGKSISFAMLVRDSSLWIICRPTPPDA